MQGGDTTPNGGVHVFDSCRGGQSVAVARADNSIDSVFAVASEDSQVVRVVDNAEFFAVEFVEYVTDDRCQRES